MRAVAPADRSIVLTGFMGTGKSTVGRAIATRLGWRFVDTDDLITERHGPIPDIFREHGEAHFRSIEAALAVELGADTRLVVATGGRMMLDDRNVAAFADTADIVCLTAAVEEIVRRVLADGAAGRPLLDVADPAERVRTLLAERAASYERFPAVDTDGRSPDEIADAVLSRLGRAVGGPT